MMALTLVSLLVQAGYMAAGQNQQSTRHADKMRAAIARIGSCPRGKVEVTLLDNTKLKGCVMDGAEDQFSVVNTKTGQSTKVAYTQVASIKRRTQSTGKSLLWLGAALAPLVFAVAIVVSAKD
jgi:hypothetical protein